MEIFPLMWKRQIAETDRHGRRAVLIFSSRVDVDPTPTSTLLFNYTIYCLRFPSN